ncbi:MAG: FAD-dependent oxidoreductase [Isosphaeraceae bacterium]
MPSLWIVSLLLASTPAQASYDVVVYGGTSAGVAAAIQAKRDGLTVVLVAPETHLGGLTTNGLGWVDSGKKEAVGGFAREVYRLIKKEYDQPDAWKQQTPASYRLYHRDDDAIWAFEPHVAEKVIEELVKQSGIPVVRNAWLDREKGVVREGTRIASIKTLDGKTYAGRMFIDATYEGDLMAAAGVRYTVGREANRQYNETLNGVQTAHAVSHQFDFDIDPYVVPGNPASGLLPRIHPGPPGVDGEADQKLQAYCYRLCLTDDPSNRVAFEKPEGYDPKQYELLGRYLRAGWRGVFNKFDPVPNRKTDTNNHGGFSTDNIGMNYDYPDASYERRRAIDREHEQYERGLFYYLSHDAGVPNPVREKMLQWGLARDEFVDNNHWPHQIYVREARRMMSDFVMTERTLRGLDPTPESVGMGSYNMDSHNVQRYVDKDGHARNEGDIQVSPHGPYPISYRSIVPRAEECTNLLVPVCLSSSHIAYGSIRMEPVFFILGQSAAAAAQIAIEKGGSVQAVDYAALKPKLLALGQVLDLPREGGKSSVIRANALAGVVVDDAQARYVGRWTVSSTVGPYVESGYRHDGNDATAVKSASFETKLAPGRYQVRLAYTPNPNRSRAVAVTIRTADGPKAVVVDQQKKPQDGPWVSLGTYAFDGPAAVEITNGKAPGYVVVDAVQFLPETGEARK